MLFLIGIDDTDNLESRGTGYRARCLGETLTREGFGEVMGITRHQLLVDPQVPYTSHNSSLCLVIDNNMGFVDLVSCCKDFLRRESAEGSDAGLCVAIWDDVSQTVSEYGQRAKEIVIDRNETVDIAKKHGFFLEGLTGDGGGIIGALAAVGLRKDGNDGRFVWVRGIRELSGVYPAEDIYKAAMIDEIRTLKGISIQNDARVDIGPWPRPVLREGKAILLVEEVSDNELCHWQVVPKEIIKNISD